MDIKTLLIVPFIIPTTEKEEINFLSKNKKASDLGIPLCKRFFEIHKGKLWISNKLGKGSNFSFSLTIKHL